MKLKIADIIVSDRIRKDYGNLDELAESIRSTGWIQPILVTPNNELIAGERRLRACRDILGMTEIPVQVADVRDAEHQLELEIVENGVRKNWTMTEMLEIARRKERLAAIRAKENQSCGQGGILLPANLPKANSRKEAATVIGVSERQYDYMKHIEDHKNLLTPSDFVDWDEGRLSTNKAYQRIKAQLEAERERNSELKASIGAMQQQLDNVDYDNDALQKLIDANTELQNDVDSITTRLKVANQQIENMRGENAELQEQLENQPVKIETRTVYPHDYEDLKRENADQKRYMEYHRIETAEHNKEREQYLSKITELKQRIAELSEDIIDEKSQVVRCAKSLMMHSYTFLSEHGGSLFVADHLDVLDPTDKDSYIKAIVSMAGWANSLLDYINGGNMIG